MRRGASTLRLSVNISTIFTEVNFLERISKAKEAGFRFIECQFPYQADPFLMKEELENNEMELTLINLPPGDWQQGERGIACLPDRVAEFRHSVEAGIDYAIKLGVKKIHCMAGITPAHIDRQRAEWVYRENIKYAASRMAANGLTLLIEPINTEDMPHYFLATIEQAIALKEMVPLKNIQLQFDFYHMERIYGGAIPFFEKYVEHIGHVQIADYPGRNQPGTGKMNYNEIFNCLSSMQYDGFIGLEYLPKTTSEASFDWIELFGLEGIK